MKEIIKFYPQIGYLLNLSDADGGETLGEKKEKWEGRRRLAALPGSHLCFCGGSNGCQPLLLGLQFAPGYAMKSLATTYFSFSFFRWDLQAAHDHTKIQEDNLKP